MKPSLSRVEIRFASNNHGMQPYDSLPVSGNLCSGVNCGAR